ncbi:hypothetical protein BDD43_2257 [Mucilaginibacter gracilis]|uniref:ACT domain-containing protein n=1 Tax=Mucilaginibacter gracilis TaxID=423350 RepID=A0A495IZD8_9SPHI|nr:hypothetical protein [Mucilaginibacter gracilis]RKR82090.1 hypothetical protein BDD43_2257 [Mucilaginibacter gracilis]
MAGEEQNHYGTKQETTILKKETFYKTMKVNYLLTILSEDRKGLVSIITTMLNRKGIAMDSIHAAKTDSHNEVLITIELWSTAEEIKNMAARLRNIIEVCRVETCPKADAWYQKVGLYTLDQQANQAGLFNQLQRHGATVATCFNDEVVVQRIGRDEDLQRLYNELEGPCLKRFSKSAAIALKPLEEQSSVISRAA